MNTHINSTQTFQTKDTLIISPGSNVVAIQPKQIPATVVVPALGKTKVPGINLKEIEALDLTIYRNSNIPASSYLLLLLLLPVIGWIALLIKKLCYVSEQDSAKSI